MAQGSNHAAGRLAAAAALVALALPAGSTAADDPSVAAGLPELSTYALENGLEVAHVQLAGAPVVTVQLWYRVGSKDEPRDRRGSAHMFEHMMFKGTERVRPEDHARYLSELGGYVNAFTTEDVTTYHNTVPRAYMDFAIELEAERMRNLIFREDMVDTEREVVKEEIRQQENNPIAVGFLRLLELAYTAHPYAWTAGGHIEDLDRTTTDDLRSFYDTYYVPNNALLVVVGDVEAREVRAAAERHFGGIPRGEDPPRPAEERPEPAQAEARREVVEPGQVGVVLAGYHIPEAAHDDVYALGVLSSILSMGESSRLNRRLVRREGIAVQAASQARVLEHPGQFFLFGVYLDPDDREAVEASLFAEIEALRDEGPSERELEKAKNQILAELAFGLRRATGLAEALGTSWSRTGDPARVLSDFERYQAVGADDIRRVASAHLRPENRTVVIVPTHVETDGGAR
jgi:zinc protease